jgi:hypothetical protein
MTKERPGVFPVELVMEFHSAAGEFDDPTMLSVV